MNMRRLFRSSLLFACLLTGSAFAANPTITDNTRTFTGSSTFFIRVALPDGGVPNAGVMLKRRFDFGLANQRATVSAFNFSTSTWTAVGSWSTPGSNASTRWRDATFHIPANLSSGAYVNSGKMKLQVARATDAGASWSEAHYAAFPHGGNGQPSGEIDVGTVAAEADAGYTSTPTNTITTPTTYAYPRLQAKAFGLSAIGGQGIADLPYLRSSLVHKHVSSAWPNFESCGQDPDFGVSICGDAIKVAYGSAPQPLDLEGGWSVLLKDSGPGCITRMWMTGIDEARKIEIFVNGTQVLPAGTTLATFFNGQLSPFVTPLTGNKLASSGGYYSYTPVCFTSSIKVRVNFAPQTGAYYNFDYFLTDADSASAITPFSMSASPASVVSTWNNVGVDPKPAATDALTQRLGETVAAGATSVMATVNGPASISSMTLLGPSTAADLNALRVQLFYDDEVSPSVNVPAGLFFGVGRVGKMNGLVLTSTNGGMPASGGNNRNLLFGVDASGFMYNYMPMPFQRSVTVKLQNTGATPITGISWAMKTRATANDAFHNVGYLKAQYNGGATVPAGATPGTDTLEWLKQSGRGQIVAVVSDSVGSAANDAFGSAATYLEGDEHISLDGARTAAVFGTGREDIFNGGFYWENGAFMRPTHGVTQKSETAGQFMNATAVRLMLGDAIPFRDGARFMVQSGQNNGWLGNVVDHTVVFFYHRPDAQLVVKDANLSVLDVGNAGDEQAAGHTYTLSGVAATALPVARTETFAFEADVRIPTDFFGGLGSNIVSTGRQLTLAGKATEFTLTIDPKNQGVLLRRLANQSTASKVDVYVKDANNAGAAFVLVQRWEQARNNQFLRGLEDDLFIPSLHTSGKSAIRVKMVLPAATSPWSEHAYTAFSVMP